MDFYGFYTGKIFDAYKYLGAHKTDAGIVFRTFAPQAHRVELLLNDRVIPMEKIYNGQFYEVTVPDAGFGNTYEYRIYSNRGCTDHCDPYGNFMELRPNHKSILWDMDSYNWGDGAWFRKRAEKRGQMSNYPINIFEIHAGSFRKPDDSRPDSWYNYEELAQCLIPYLRDCGYNYVEFLPLCEHPCDESWGYQTTGYFSPTSRYGNPTQLKKLIDLLHHNNIGAILDFVPVHFAMDSYALANYDGCPLYEYPNNDVGKSEWGSCNFMHSRGEVRSFLQSSANYWLKEFHFDGLRMDAISNIIYWQGDWHRGVNANAVEFVKTMNRSLKEMNHDALLFAEDSTSFKGITKSYNEGGLGFDFKWDLGWMNDTLFFFSNPPEKRPEYYHKLTFSMMYFWDEHYMLPLSHDEVVHGKGTIVNKMYGTLEEKIRQARAMYLYMYVHPGKKLNFMANEIGQLREWDERRQPDVYLYNDPLHRSFHEYIKALNHLYLSEPALFEEDYSQHGFEWADCHQEQRLIYAIIRRSKDQNLLAVFNFKNEQQNYSLDIKGRNFGLILNSDEASFGRNDLFRQNGNTLNIDLPAYSGLLFRFDND